MSDHQHHPQQPGHQAQSAPHPDLGQQFAAQPDFGQPVATDATPRRQILGLHPALFMGILLLIAVAILAIVLVFTGDIAQHGAKVFWTLVTFVAFTGLLALDLTLSRRTARPLIIGTVANSYMIIALVLSIWIWMRTSRPDQYGWDWEAHDASWELVGQVPMIIFVTRAAWALSWAVLVMGDKIKIALGPVFGMVTAGLTGLAAVLLTLHVPLYRFGVDVSDWYWRTLVAVLILTALAACILLLLFWNNRNSEAPRVRPQTQAPVSAGAVPNPNQMQTPGYSQPMPPAQQQGYPQQPGFQQPGPYQQPSYNQQPGQQYTQPQPQQQQPWAPIGVPPQQPPPEPPAGQAPQGQ